MTNYDSATNTCNADDEDDAYCGLFYEEPELIATGSFADELPPDIPRVERRNIIPRGHLKPKQQNRAVPKKQFRLQGNR